MFGDFWLNIDIFWWFDLFRATKEKMGEGEKFQLGTIGALSLSVVSSVSIVICNKTLMSSLHFIFGKFMKGLVYMLQKFIGVFMKRFSI